MTVGTTFPSKNHHSSLSSTHQEFPPKTNPVSAKKGKDGNWCIYISMMFGGSGMILARQFRKKIAELQVEFYSGTNVFLVVRICL